MDKRISVDPDVCGGKPCIQGTRIMVKNILGMLAGGYTVARIVQAYPELTAHDISAALEYASQVINEGKRRDWGNNEVGEGYSKASLLP